MTVHAIVGGRGQRVAPRVVTDAALVAGIAARQRSALAAAYRRHGAEVHRLAAQLVGDSAADDVLHDVFVDLWRSPHELEASGRSLRGLLCDSARRRCRTTVTPEASRPLDGLAPAQREAIALASVGGHTYTDVAALLGVSADAVRTDIRSGLRTLRATMLAVEEPVR